MSLALQSRHVVITGASRGLGLGIAKAFAAEGARLTLLADDPEVEAVAARLKAEGAVLDITDEAAVIAAFAKLGPIDVLINNAGLERMTPIEDAGAENTATFKRIVEINVVGTMLVTRAALALMRDGGRIINTASVWGRVAEPLFGAYVASKHAVIGLTKTWARELGPRGIAVNAVCPGWVKTQASLRSLAVMAAQQNRPEDQLLGDILSAQAMPGLMEPHDIAGPYLFLASSLAANITGQSVGVDRGEVPW